MSDKVIVRFAPSPTGPLHIGGVRTALYNYLFARKHGGKLILRIEDTDQTRYVPGAEEYIVEALRWCGITFDEGVFEGGANGPYRQSERKHLYRQYADELVSRGKAYIAFDTPEELEAMREKYLELGQKAVLYNFITRNEMTNSLTLPSDEVEKRIAAGDPYVIRLLVPNKEEVRFHDQIRDWVVIHSSQIDDKVLLKSDGMPTYHLANVVDDHLMGITHVIRGEEWLPSTPLHVLLYRAFGWEDTMPKFAHLSLILNPEGKGKLKKRDGDKYGFPVFPIEWNNRETNEVFPGFREAGYLPDAVINFLALLGWNPGQDEELMDRQRLIEAFSLDRVVSSGARFDLDKLKWFNQTYLRQMPDEEILPLLQKAVAEAGYSGYEDSYLQKVIALMKERVTFVQEIVEQALFFFEAPKSFDEKMSRKNWKTDNRDYLAGLAKEWEMETDWTAPRLNASFEEYAEKNAIGKGKILAPLRLAITGIPFGPGAFDIMETIGKAESLSRIAFVVNELPPNT